MVTIKEPQGSKCGGFAGLRLTADEYYALPEDGSRYELIDGVVQMSPSSAPDHQYVASILFHEIMTHVQSHRLGLVLFETDVHLGKAMEDKDLVYRPEIIFIASNRVARVKRKRIDIVPDLVVEIISPDSRSLDSVTKFHDYESAGVCEYWLIDPERGALTFYGLKEGKFVALTAEGSVFPSRAVLGLRLDLSRIHQAFSALG